MHKIIIFFVFIALSLSASTVYKKNKKVNVHKNKYHKYISYKKRKKTYKKSIKNKKRQYTKSQKIKQLINMRTNNLLKRYKKLVQENKIDTQEAKYIFNILKSRFDSDKYKYSSYDTIAILNALEDIEYRRVNKYEALLTLETMIEEIR